MDKKDNLELTIRTASVIKGLSELINCSSRQVARLVLQELSPQFGELVKFVTTEGKGEKHV